MSKNAISKNCIKVQRYAKWVNNIRDFFLSTPGLIPNVWWPGLWRCARRRKPSLRCSVGTGAVAEAWHPSRPHPTVIFFGTPPPPTRFGSVLKRSWWTLNAQFCDFECWGFGPQAGAHFFLHPTYFDCCMYLKVALIRGAPFYRPGFMECRVWPLFRLARSSEGVYARRNFPGL